jgi:hypothetical protein
VFSVESLFKIRNSPLELLMIFQVAVSLIDSISQSVSEAGKHFSDLGATSEPLEPKKTILGAK